ncbi:MAG: site-specific integrase [Rhizobiaceae bacterium]
MPQSTDDSAYGQTAQGLLLRRAEELDALDSVLPFGRRELLAGLLTDDDITTLRHLARQGIGENSLRALASDLAYLEAWCFASTGAPLPWPAPEVLLIKFVAHHLWDTVRRETDPTHGMPAHVAEVLKQQGILRTDQPHAPSTVRRRLSSWSTLTSWRGMSGAFNAPTLRSAIKLAVRASQRPRKRKSEKAVTADILASLLDVCATDRLMDVRDRAMLLVAFASGGRRRGEIAALRVEQLVEQDPVPADPRDPSAELLPCLRINLNRTKSTQADDGAFALLVGRPVFALKDWLKRSAITEGAIFRAIDRWGHLDQRALTPQAVNLILKRRVAQAALDPAAFSAHGLRAGFLTESAKRGIPLPEAMQQSQHKSVQQASRYYNDAERQLGRAARLII